MNGPTRLEFHVAPGAARPGLVGRHGAAGNVEIDVPAEAGHADEAAIRLLAAAVPLARGAASIVAGFASREKIAAFDGSLPNGRDARLASRTPAGKGAR